MPIASRPSELLGLPSAPPPHPSTLTHLLPTSPPTTNPVTPADACVSHPLLQYRLPSGPKPRLLRGHIWSDRLHMFQMLPIAIKLSSRQPNANTQKLP